jgi:glycosyltransferase involved in cell wall biosynthesis
MQSPSRPQRHRVALSVNAAWNVVNFRAGLVRGLLQAGYEVVVIAPDDGHAEAVKALGARFTPIQLDRKGRNPLAELATLRRYRSVLQAEQPDAYLGFTIKPNIYGSMACHRLGIPVLNNIAGLGTMFGKNSLSGLLVRALYKHALQRSARVLFQNDDDQDLFVQGGIVKPAQCLRVPGSGVDLARFAPTPLPCEAAGAGAPVKFLLSARLLWDKGVKEYVAAAQLLRQRGVSAECSLLGLFDDGNPGAIPRQQVQAWHDSGVIRFLGSAKDVRIPLSDTDCVVLPSFYREGVPRTLLEAASMARPLIATDAVGCRDAVDDERSGYLVRPMDAADLADKMERIVRASPEERAGMGRLGREKMASQFDEQIVVHRYIEELDRILRTS